MNLLAQFYLQVDEDPASGCWIWTGRVNSSGYPQFRSANRDLLAHRWHWRRLRDPDLPRQTDLHHKCENRLCVNLDHLEPLPKKRHARRHLRTDCSRGHPFDDANTYVTASGARSCRTCHREEEMRRRGGPKPRQQPRKTHCVNGHPLEGDNLYVYTTSKGYVCWSCRICRNEAARRHIARTRDTS